MTVADSVTFHLYAAVSLAFLLASSVRSDVLYVSSGHSVVFMRAQRSLRRFYAYVAGIPTLLYVRGKRSGVFTFVFVAGAVTLLVVCSARSDTFYTCI